MQMDQSASFMFAVGTAINVAYESAVITNKLYDYARTNRGVYSTWEVVALHGLRKNYDSLRPKFGILEALALVLIFPRCQ